MRKVVLAVLVIALVVSCKPEKKVDYVLLSGKIINPVGGEVILGDKGVPTKGIKVNKDGTFKDTIKGITNGYYTLGHGRETTKVYLENGFDINVTLDTKEFDETVTYQGKGADMNNYLAKKYLLEEKELGNLKDLYSLEEADFLKKVNNFKSNVSKNLKAVTGEFVKKENKALTYEHALKVSLYERYHGLITKNNDFKVSSNFPNVLEGVDLTNEGDFSNYPAYEQLVSNNFFETSRKEASEKGKELQEVVVERVKAMKGGVIRNSLIASLSEFVRDGNEGSKKVYNTIMKLSTDEKLKARLTKKMEVLKNLAKGKPSPTFENYENYKGGTTSLKDLKGKFVYVDVWATWCGPCKAEIPHLLKLEKKYHGKKIEFVSISVDKAKDKEKWKQMIEDKKMGGIQLFSDMSWSSNFVQKYGIRGIPRFILIDPQGNIVTSDAPRPSQLETIEKLFKENGI